MTNSEGTGWLGRLGASQAFFSVADERPDWRRGSLRGLAAGAIPDAVRMSHGYKSQMPTDAPEWPREPQRGDFFRA
jgi:hypothetical protein